MGEEVKDFEVEALRKKLEDVWWEKFKLRINKARFEKGGEKEGIASGHNHPQRLLLGNDRLVSDELSFKSLLVWKEHGGGEKVDKDGMVVGSDGGRKKTRVLSMGEGGIL
ncbi:hypothetical protein P8452_26089 [Trifolium repens]|nr:hypothetical protein P8452_26089 [Trifolium repens]